MRDSMRTGRPLAKATTNLSGGAAVHCRSACPTAISIPIPQRSVSSSQSAAIEAVYAAQAASSKFVLQAPPPTYRYRPTIPTVRQLPTTMRRPVLSSLKSDSLMNSSAKKSLDTSTGITDSSLLEQGYGLPYESMRASYTGRAPPPTLSEESKGSWLGVLWEEWKWTWHTGPSDSPFGKDDSGSKMQRTMQPSTKVTSRSPHNSGPVVSSSYNRGKDSRTETDTTGSDFTRVADIRPLQRSQSAPTNDDLRQHGRTFSLASTGHSYRALDKVPQVNSEGQVVQRALPQARGSLIDGRRDTTISDATRMSDYFAVHDREGRRVDSDRIKKYRPTPLRIPKNTAPSIANSQMTDPRFPNFSGAHRNPTMTTGVSSAMSMSNYSQPGITPRQSPVSNIIDHYSYRDNIGIQTSRSGSGAQEYTHPRAGWDNRMGWNLQQQPQGGHVYERGNRDSISEYSDLYDATAASARF